MLASLRASATAEIPIKVWAVEKNPNAVVTLRCMKQDLGWEDRVTIVASDMREVGWLVGWFVCFLNRKMRTLCVVLWPGGYGVSAKMRLRFYCLSARVTCQRALR